MFTDVLEVLVASIIKAITRTSSVYFNQTRQQYNPEKTSSICIYERSNGRNETVTEC
jgi:hypothetical protein